MRFGPLTGLPAPEWALGEFGRGPGSTENQFSLVDARLYQLRSLIEATPEERTVYRKWLRGMILVYGTLLLMSGVAAVASYSVVGPTQFTKLSVPHAPASPRAN